MRKLGQQAMKHKECCCVTKTQPMGSSDETERLVEEADSECDQDGMYEVADILKEREGRFYVAEVMASTDSDDDTMVTTDGVEKDTTPNYCADISGRRFIGAQVGYSLVVEE
ncbi:hypothetical protein GN958_ATG03318 [Phytophthora infestans]|uniref:Uncharacterized protein n=1 Tax=Phytophthora infestans TaxID=4787 RepID=A0A8S9V3R7_PHYIN|nr:hypothetical protein GN958_ATG03318 [Phytophthora infestans]